jgi:hypothetical protein
MNFSLSTREIASTACFAALYVIFSFWTLFPIVGAEGKWINAAVVMAPLFGMILGSHLGVLAITIGGLAGSLFQPIGPFGSLSFVPHAAAAFCSGMTTSKKQHVCVVTYALFLFLLTFFPVVGPVWLWPFMIWLDLIGLVVLASPAQSKATKAINETSDSWRLIFGLATTCFTATLFGHVTGSVLFEAIYWDSNVDFWRTTWQGVTFVYPIERGLITLVAVAVGTPILKALEKCGLKTG